jgi:hypothetical protein
MGWKRIYNPEMAGFKISWFWPSTKSYYIILFVMLKFIFIYKVAGKKSRRAI